MHEPQILSTPPAKPAPAVQHPPKRAPRPAARALVFDACHVGVVLRAVLFVEGVLAVGAMFGAATPLQWLERLALMTSGALPATLGWLIAGCSAKHLLARLPTLRQAAVGVLLGALAGAFACLMLVQGGVAEAWAAPWLACSASGALLAALLVAALVLRARARTPAATTARLTELQSRIRPHFLFNTLNSAIALVREEPAKAEALLEDLSDLFRHALLEQSEATTLAEEIALARRYLGIEQVRFGERLRVQWTIDARAGGARLPPLLLQPLVENAVKHGVEPNPEGGKLRIATQLRGRRVLVRIANTLPPDDGRTPGSTRGHGIALANVRARLALLHDVDCEFITEIHHGRYEVRITLPAPAERAAPLRRPTAHAYPDR